MEKIESRFARFDTYMDSSVIASQVSQKLILSTEIEIANIYPVS
jgi:hypothetical protein